MVAGMHGGRHGCRPGDRQGRTPCRSTPPLVCDPAGARHRGGLSLGIATISVVTSLYSGHPALRPSGRLRRSHALLRVRGHAKRSNPLVGRRAEARRRRATWRYRDNRSLTSLGPGLRRDDEHGDRGEKRSRTECAPTNGEGRATWATKKTGRFRGPFSMRGKRVAYFSLASARSASALSVFSHENAV